MTAPDKTPTLKTTCAELPTVAVIRACRATLKTIERTRRKRRAEIIERHRWHKPMFSGQSVRLSDAEAESRARRDSPALDITDRLAYTEMETRVRGLLALAAATPRDTLFVSRGDFADIRGQYEPEAPVHAPAST